MDISSRLNGVIREVQRKKEINSTGLAMELEKALRDVPTAEQQTLQYQAMKDLEQRALQANSSGDWYNQRGMLTELEKIESGEYRINVVG